MVIIIRFQIIKRVMFSLVCIDNSWFTFNWALLTKLQNWGEKKILLLPTFLWLVKILGWYVVVFSIQISWTEVAFTIQIFRQLCFDKFSICFITPILSFCQEFTPAKYKWECFTALKYQLEKNCWHAASRLCTTKYVVLNLELN